MENRPRDPVSTGLRAVAAVAAAWTGLSCGGTEPSFVPADDDTPADDDSAPDDDVNDDDAADDTAAGPCGGEPRWDRRDAALGLVAPQPIDPASPDPFDYQMGGGGAVADLDGDGILDVFLVDPTGPDHLFWGQPDGRFVEGAGAAGLQSPTERANGASAADYDGDGDTDLLVLNTGTTRLYRNEGGRAFLDVTVLAGLDDGVPRRSVSGGWADYDGDGDLDLFESDHTLQGDGRAIIDGLAEGDGSRLLRNEGDGTLTDVTDELPFLEPKGAAWQGAWIDLDGDGDLDLVVVNDFGQFLVPNEVFRNDGPAGGGAWRWEEVGADSGLDLAAFLMAAAFGDADGDGDQDALVTLMPGLIYLEHVGPWSWFDATAASGLAALDTPVHDVSFDVLFEDLDNDGRDDAVVLYSHMIGFYPSYDVTNSEQQENVVLFGEGAGLVPAPEGHDLADPGPTRSLAVADFNADGTPDFVMGVLDDDARLYLSRPECTQGHWLDVRVRAPGTLNLAGVSATVSVEVAGRRQVRMIDGGFRTAAISSPPVAHFGLGSALAADRVEVRLPDGRTEVLVDVSGDGAVEVVFEPP